MAVCSGRLFFMEVMTMNQELRNQFRKKIERCYAAHIAEWYRQSPEELVSNAYRIGAMKQIAEILPNTANEYEMAYLIQFKDPLLIVTDAWAFEKEYVFDFDDQLSAVLWELADKCDADGVYERENPERGIRMNQFFSEEMVSIYKQKYPSGTKLCVDSMPDDPKPVESGTVGRVTHVDDMGTPHCIFEDGRVLGVIPETDKFHIVQEESEEIGLNLS